MAQLGLGVAPRFLQKVRARPEILTKKLGLLPRREAAPAERRIVKVGCSENEVVRPVTPNPETPTPFAPLVSKRNNSATVGIRTHYFEIN